MLVVAGDGEPVAGAGDGLDEAEGLRAGVDLILAFMAAEAPGNCSGHPAASCSKAPPTASTWNRSAQLLAASPRVTAVHDLHAWTVTSGFPAVSAHVVVDGSCFSDGHAPRILDALQAALIGQFDIEHSTLQLELPAHAGHEKGAHYRN